MKLSHRVAHRYLKARQDRELIAQANKIYKDLVQYITKTDISQMALTNKLEPVAVGRVYWDEVEGEGLPLVRFSKNTPHSNSDLSFIFHVGGTKTYMGTQNQSSYIGVGMRGYWVEGETLQDQILYVLKKERGDIIHEITHYLDYVRLRRGHQKAKDSYKTPEEDRGGYFNHPLELNAYFIQALSGITEDIEEQILFVGKGGRVNDHQVAVFSISEWLDQYGNNFSKFLKSFWVKAPRNFKTMLTPENKKRFEKRVYDTWDKLQRQMHQIKKELISSNDPAALLAF